MSEQIHAAGYDDEQGEGEEGSDSEQEKSLYLVRQTMLPVADVVYCLDHTAVHGDTCDPYGMGTDECRKSEHRKVYYRGHKGDIDERVEDKRLGEAGGGSGDDESRPNQPEDRLIAPSSTDTLTFDERELVLLLVGQLQTSAGEAVEALRRILGDQVPALNEIQDKLNLSASVFHKLGGD